MIFVTHWIKDHYDKYDEKHHKILLSLIKTAVLCKKENYGQIEFRKRTFKQEWFGDLVVPVKNGKHSFS